MGGMLFMLTIFAAFPGEAMRIENKHLQVAALSEKGRYFGFTIQPAGRHEPIAKIRLGSIGNIVASSARVRKEGTTQVLRFSQIKAEPTPELDNSSFIEIRLFANDPYPQVRFKLQLQSFNASAWQEAFGRVPFHFIACSLHGAEIFHQRGWMLGTPVIDRYILLDAGPTNFIQAQWAKGWSYAPPFGAYPLPVAGLWKP
ncbi:MAG: hypothetical protein NZ781_11375, partial [Armatimonadetes bacterium]|nr:hypothetical protein [Armatimonadota bacterium]